MQLAAEAELIDLADGAVSYRWHGPEEGPVVVLVHGFQYYSMWWDPNVEALAAAGFRVLRYDLYGRGYSDRPALRYDVDLYDRQLVGLLDALGLVEAVDLVGASMGGAIVTVFAARHPERVGRVALLDPAGLPVNQPAVARLLKAPFIGPWLTTVFGEKICIDFALSHWKDRSLVPVAAARLREQMAYRGYMQALLSTLRSYPLSDVRRAYAAVGESGRPVLLLWGEEDNTAPIANARTLQELVPQLEFHPMSGIGHSLSYERAELVNPMLVKFLTEQGAFLGRASNPEAEADSLPDSPAAP